MITPLKDKVQPKELPYLSASSINMYLKDPAAWVLKHFYDIKTEDNVFSLRGKIIENSLNDCLKGKKFDECTQYIIDNVFEQTFFFKGMADQIDFIEGSAESWLDNCLKGLKELGVEIGLADEAFQGHITGEYMELPLQGYLDYIVGDHQIDLKTTNTVPKIVSRGKREGMLPAAKSDNVRQQVLYKLLTGRKTTLLYVSPDDYLSYEITNRDVEEMMPSIEEAVEEIKYLLSIDIDAILSIIKPNWKTMEYSFYWNDITKKAAKQIWKVK